jgi:hypothetical protein
MGILVVGYRLMGFLLHNKDSRVEIDDIHIDLLKGFRTGRRNNPSLHGKNYITL